MKRITTSLLIVAAAGAMVAGCTTTSTGRGYANRNGQGQGACIANPNASCEIACQANGQGPGARMVGSDAPCQSQCLANGPGPGPRSVAANSNGRGNGQGRGPGNANGMGRGQNGCGAKCIGNGNRAPNVNAPQAIVQPVNEATADALRATLEDELTARAFYAAILAKHGDVRPFANIMRAEERHAEAILALMERYQVDQTGVAARTLPEIPATLTECAKLAAQIERDNISMYDRFAEVATQADIKNAFQRLRSASLNNHLPAFERIAGA